MKNLLIGIAAALALPVMVAQAEDAPAPPNPARVDFSDLAAAYGEPRVMINIGTPLLRLVSAIKHEDPVANVALQDLESIHVHVYDTFGDLEPALERANEISERLNADNWERIVHAKEDGKDVNIFMKQDDTKIHGLAVMAIDGEEAVFINILGSISPDDLAKVMAQVDVDVDL